MTSYALLPRAAGNRVYGAAAVDLTRAELDFVCGRLFPGLVVKHDTAVLGGVEYVVVDCGDRSLDDLQVVVLSNLSSLHALFARSGGSDGDGLIPVTVTRRAEQDDDITTIQRYVGKTNETFTRLLVNVTLAAGTRSFHRLLAGDRLRLLDPLCGRGTALHQAVVYGLDAYGIEIDRRDVEAYDQFVVTWLQDKRIKHQVERAKLRRGRTTPATRLTIAYGPPGDERHRIEVVNDDTLNAADHVRERSIDVLVADLPYGVQHETRPGGDGRIARRPDELLRRALPVWRRLLRPGGAMGLAWNLRTLDRPRLFALLAGAGFRPCQAEDDDAFVHKVDRAITRDLVVATPTPPR
jgi:SAM-dependent methyltransferase